MIEKASGSRDTSLAKIAAESNAPRPMPASIEMYIVAIARPRPFSSLRSTVQADRIGERIPVAKPKKTAPVKNRGVEAAKPVQSMAMMSIEQPTTTTSTRP